MTQDKEPRPLNELPQVYDSSLKEWIFQQAPTILPLLLPGAIYKRTLTVEQIRPTIRMDKVFKMMYHGKAHILHLEFQTGFDKQLVARLLIYNAGLYHDYHLPVITVVIYPFRVTMAVPPLHIKGGEDEILTFRFKTLPLFELDAEDFVREHHTAMYPVLPTMKNVHADLVFQVMQELEELYRDDEITLAQQFIWMNLLLERTDVVSDLEKEQIKERLSMYDQLFEESPMIQKMREDYRVKGLQEGLQEGRQEGLQEGIQQGELLALRRMLVNFVRKSYPDLVELAQQQASRFNKPSALELLVQQVMTAPNASTAHWLLESSAQQ